MSEMRVKAAKKAAKTRASNQAALERWLTVDKPAREMEAAIINRALITNPVRLRWAGRYQRRLKNGVEGATLIKVLGTGLRWSVLIDGYKQPQEYHPSFWELDKNEA